MEEVEPRHRATEGVRLGFVRYLMLAGPGNRSPITNHGAPSGRPNGRSEQPYTQQPTVRSPGQVRPSVHERNSPTFVNVSHALLAVSASRDQASFLAALRHQSFRFLEVCALPQPCRMLVPVGVLCHFEALETIVPQRLCAFERCNCS